LKLASSKATLNLQCTMYNVQFAEDKAIESFLSNHKV
jgi:hypothetical protein